MKRLISVLLAFIIFFSFAACTAKDTYETDKAAIVQTMNELTEATTNLGNELIKIGKVTGAQDLLNYLSKVLSINTLQDYLDEIANDSKEKYWESYTDELFGTYLNKTRYMNLTAQTTQRNAAVEKFIDYSNEFTTLKNNVRNKYEVLATEIKTFKENHEKKHSEGVDLIVEYYLLCSEYAENILETDCSFTELQTYVETCPEKSEQLLKRIELE